LETDRSVLTFRLISVPQLQGIRTGEASLVSRNHEDEDCTAERCVFDEAWGPTDCNYITWNTAVCTYPLFISGDSAETTWQALKEKGVSRNNSNSQWKTEGIWDCLEPSPTETGPKWIVKLRPPKQDGHSDGDEDEAWEELARTTFNMYFGSLFEIWRGDVIDNEYDGHEDDGWDELAETTFNEVFGRP
jgi:hypothetical protein